LALLLLASCSDQTVGSRNVLPEASILVPESGFSTMEGAEVLLRGQVSDHRTDPLELRVSWSSSIDGQLAEGFPDTDGTTQVTVPSLTAGEHTITLRVLDPDGAPATDTVTISVTGNVPPSIQITAPTAEGVYYSDLPLTLRSIVGDTEDAPEDMRVGWTLDTGEVLAEGLSPDSAGETTAGANLEQGTYILVAGVTDSAGKTASDTVTVVVGPPNTMPSCDLELPELGASVPFGELVIFEGTATDIDVPSDWLTVTFESNVDGYLGAVSPSSTSIFAFATTALTPTTHTVTMIVTDEVGGTCSDFTLITVSTPPTVTITGPATGTMFNETDTISFTGEAHDAEEPDSSLIISWVSDLSGSLGGTSPDSSGFVALNVPGMSPGTHLVTLSASNASGLTGTGTTNLLINHVPTAPSVSIAPTSPTTADDLVLTINVPSSDADGPSALTDIISWTRDNTPEPAFAGLLTIPASATLSDENWEATVTATDGFATSVAGTADVTVGNSLPSISTATLSPTIDLASTTYSLTISGWADADGDLPGYIYQWYAGAFPIAGQTAATLVPAGQPPGTILYCVVTPFDGVGSGTPVTSSTAVINTAPTAPVVSISPAAPGTGDSLVVSIDVASSDVDGGPSAITYNYAWSVDGNPQPAWNGVATIPATATGADEQWSVGVTASDGLQDSGTASAGVTVTNSSPSITGATVAPALGLATDLFSVTATGWTDPDGDPPGYLYQWYAGTTQVVGATSDTWVPATYPAANVPGTSIWVEVTPWDGFAPGLPVVGTAVINTPPTVSGVSITPTSADESSTLTASYSGTADVDGQSITVSWQWYVGGTPIIGATSSTITGANFARFDSISARATPFDGLESGLEYPSNTVVISNTAPETSAPVIDQSALYTNTAATCSGAVGSDLDGDPVTISYTWLVNGTDPGISGPSISPSAYVRGDTVACVATPDDGNLSGPALSSPTLSVQNSPPTAPVTLVSPAYPTPQDDLECSIYSASTDADGDTLTYDILWLQNGLPTAWGLTGASLGAVATVPDSVTLGGDTWTCEISGWDGLSSGPPGTGVLDIDPCLSLEFDGSSDVVTMSPYDATGSGAFTVEAWVFWPGTSLGTTEVVAAQFSGPNERWRASIVSQDTGTACSGSPGSLLLEGGGSCVVSSFAMADGFWHHLAWIWNGGSVSLFIDGQSAGAGSLSISGTTSDSLSLGAAAVLDSLDGGLDEVRISSIQRYSGPFVPETRHLDDLSTLGLWHFDEAMGSLAADDSSSGADGTISGAQWSSSSVCDADPCDIDGDGSDSPLCGGGDCDDSNPAFGPYASDTVGDGIDHNCDGMDCEGSMIGGNYFNLCDDSVTWYEAETFCVAGGYASLATIGNAVEQAGVESLVLALGVPYDHYWIGLNDQQTEGSFVWADGDPFIYSNWLAGEPNAASTSEDCVHFWKLGSGTNSGRWNDNECAYPLSYICGY